MTKEKWISLLRALLVLSLILLVCWFLSGCKTQVVTVPEYHTVYQTDTLNTHDSIYINVREYIQGETVRKDSIVYRDRWRDRVVEKEVRDSIPYPVEVVKEVHTRSGYDRFVSWGFWILVVGTIVYWAAKIAYKIYFRK